MRSMRRLSAVLFVCLLGGCDWISSPDSDVLSVHVSGAVVPHALALELRGPHVANLRGCTDCTAFIRESGADVQGLIVLGPFTGSVVAEADVPRGANASDYTVALIEAAGPDHALLPLEGLTATVDTD